MDQSVKSCRLTPIFPTTYLSCWKFDPDAPSGKRWNLVRYTRKNQNNYLFKIINNYENPED